MSTTMHSAGPATPLTDTPPLTATGREQGATGGLLVVTAHPDDETLIAGGTLAACAAAGIPTAVVCLTRGEAGPISDPALATRANLGAVRLAELHAACAELGVDWLRCYRRMDAHLPWSDAGAIARQLARIVAERHPAAIVTFGEDGLYYHPDHIAALEFTQRALARVADPPALYRAAWPDSLMRELVHELRRRRLPSDLWGIDAAEFGIAELDDAAALDVRPFVRHKLRALRRHRTQVGPGHAFTAIPADLAERFLGYEWFVPVAGGRTDWLERAVTVGRERAAGA
jgi:N-acetyl-1-D-myo-inositol-2-amino-2-deoxy-alpha-D-glucopyranoside deacetylase